MTDRVLSKCEVCAVCGEKMSAGETFRWYAVQMGSSSKVGTAKTVWKKAHKDNYCGAKKFEKERLLKQIKGLEAAIEDIDRMIEASLVDEVKNALATVTNNMRTEIDILNTKRKEVDLW